MGLRDPLQQRQLAMQQCTSTAQLHLQPHSDAIKHADLPGLRDGADVRSKHRLLQLHGHQYCDDMFGTCRSNKSAQQMTSTQHCCLHQSIPRRYNINASRTGSTFTTASQDGAA